MSVSVSKINHCSPLRQGKTSDWTCFTIHELLILCKMWNKSIYSKNSKIDTDYITQLVEISGLCDKLNSIILDYNKVNVNKIVDVECFPVEKYIWNILYNKFFPFCGMKNETCWIDNKYINVKNELKKNFPDLYILVDKFIFKPQGTKEQYGWLSTTNIIQVMHQYQVLHPNFKFIDCVPSDHYILNPHEYPSINLFQKYKYLAVVFNIDESHQPGSHWVTVFFENIVTNDNKNVLLVEYFDSTGNDPIDNIKEFMYSKNIDSFEKVYYINKFQHQNGDSECGVFALFYIQQRILGYTFQDFQIKRLPDKMMNSYRLEFFRPHQV
jgi:hypothetical protein